MSAGDIDIGDLRRVARIGCGELRFQILRIKLDQKRRLSGGAALGNRIPFLERKANNVCGHPGADGHFGLGKNNPRRGDDLSEIATDDLLQAHRRPVAAVTAAALEPDADARCGADRKD